MLRTIWQIVRPILSNPCILLISTIKIIDQSLYLSLFLFYYLLICVASSWLIILCNTTKPGEQSSGFFICNTSMTDLHKSIVLHYLLPLQYTILYRGYFCCSGLYFNFLLFCYHYFIKSLA